MPLARHAILIDDDRVIVNRFDFAPGDETGPHRHALPYVIVPLTDGLLRITAPDGSESTASLTQGLPYSRAAGVEHNVFNGGSAPLSFLEIELKDR
ncbi:MAG: cupin domain-containing protein [Defluviimonas sp.]|uniref:cupin domain-containing protein n=1 Tax=Albidovulum sp. TaxID=1872424 RepID=UPI001DBC0456|nr:cupin domain-containing protein [Paracoccaceae bacterium]MCC0063651.1 cupin domain-containing protein [Defluviimonas sp.]